LADIFINAFDAIMPARTAAALDADFARYKV
jgi:hypothetical protein